MLLKTELNPSSILHFLPPGNRKNNKYLAIPRTMKHPQLSLPISMNKSPWLSHSVVNSFLTRMHPWRFCPCNYEGLILGANLSAYRLEMSIHYHIIQLSERWLFSSYCCFATIYPQMYGLTQEPFYFKYGLRVQWQSAHLYTMMPSTSSEKTKRLGRTWWPGWNHLEAFHVWCVACWPEHWHEGCLCSLTPSQHSGLRFVRPWCPWQLGAPNWSVTLNKAELHHHLEPKSGVLQHHHPHLQVQSSQIPPHSGEDCQRLCRQFYKLPHSPYL